MGLSTSLLRRLATATGIYSSAALGLAGSLVVLRLLGPTDFGRYSIVLGVVQFVALLIELTSDEALVKFGFRYAAREDWGRFHRVVRVTFAFEIVTSLLSGGIIAAFAPFASDVFHRAPGLTVPLLLAALIPLLQSMESMGAQLLILRGRYDVRSAFLVLGMGLRLAGLAAGAPHGVTAAVLGYLAAQVLTTTAISSVGLVALRRFPAASPVPLGPDRRSFIAFVLQSAADTSLDSFRSWIAPLALGVVRDARAVGLFRGAQAPQTGFSVLSSPVRLIMLTEQTRDWEHGRPEVVVAGVRRYTLAATALMAVVLPPVEWAMPWIVRLVLGHKYVPAIDAARLVVGAAAIQLVLGWTKSFPVTIGRPWLRVVAHAVELVVLLPAIVIMGKEWGVTGAGGAVLASSVAFAAAWGYLALRLRREHRTAVAAGADGYFA
ncbi:MAG: oligosaccharide flippase family protein [Actinobacteria bacterium]|nr:oligosaccharide flippase family protein [Actinomycetota bacterium]